MAKGQVLVIDDEEDILELLKFNLVREGYGVTTATSGEQALATVRTARPDAIILDLMLPGVDGLDLCKTLKSDADTVNIPIIMLTAKGEEADMVTGLEIGADDYIPKPFSPRVVLARVKAVMRRAGTLEEPGQIIKIGDIVIAPNQHQVTAGGSEVELTATEFRILHLLARRPGWVYSRDQIVDAIQGPMSEVTSRSVDVHIVNLRKKLGTAGELVETVRGIGYRIQSAR